MSRRQTKPTKSNPGRTSTPTRDQLRPMSRARPLHLPSVAGMEEGQAPYPHEPMPPTAYGLSRAKMERPRIRPSNSGNSIASEAQQIKDSQRVSARPLQHGQHQQQSTGDASLHFPQIEHKVNAGQRIQAQLPKIDETAGHTTHFNPSIQLPSLNGKVPAPPEFAKPGIPRCKAFSHTHMQENTPHHPPGRRFKHVVHAEHAVVTGLPPAPPARPVDYAPAACHGSKMPTAAAVEAKLSDHIISVGREKIHLSPSDLRLPSPGSQGSRSHVTINHEIIRSPSSLNDVTNKESGHSLHEKRNTSLIDVNIQPTKIGSTSAASDKQKRRRGGRC